MRAVYYWSRAEPQTESAAAMYVWRLTFFFIPGNGQVTLKASCLTKIPCNI